MKERFEAFLIENDAVDNFKEELRDGNIKETFDEYVTNSPVVHLISSAFLWDKTRGGTSYWYKLHTKWFKELEKEKE